MDSTIVGMLPHHNASVDGTPGTSDVSPVLSHTVRFSPGPPRLLPRRRAGMKNSRSRSRSLSRGLSPCSPAPSPARPPALPPSLDARVVRAMPHGFAIPSARQFPDPLDHPPQQMQVYTDNAAANIKVRRECDNCHTSTTSTWRRSILHPGQVVRDSVPLVCPRRFADLFTDCAAASAACRSVTSAVCLSAGSRAPARSPGVRASVDPLICGCPRFITTR